MPSTATTIRTTLRRLFGFDTFRPGQREALESLLRGQHTLVVMSTGSGKSLVYQLGSLHTDGLTVVASPLIALMQDQVNVLQNRNIPAAYINSTLPSHQQQRRLDKLTAGAYELIYVAPERFRSSRFRRALAKVHVGLLAIDEAHCISEWGHDFRPDFRRISTARKRMGDPLTVALTATATPAVRDDIAKTLDLEMHRIVTGFNRPNLTFSVLQNTSTKAKLAAIDRLLTARCEQESPGAVLIYTGTRREAEEAAAYVRDAVGMDALHYHAGLEVDARHSIQKAFLQGHQPVIAATNAFGMGIDRSDVRLVIHYTMPGSLEAYYQEAGRAGRDGQPAEAVLLYDPTDRSLHDYFIANSLPSLAQLRSLHKTLTRRGRQPFFASISDLSGQTGLHPVLVRVALEQLETAQVVQHLRTEGLRFQLRTGHWRDAAVRKRLKMLETYAKHRRLQLEDMVAYAETDSCRRRHILSHFGDQSDEYLTHCCDNCSQSQIHHDNSGAKTQIALSQNVILPDNGAELERKVVAWGNNGQLERVPHLVAALSHERYNVRRLSASALGKLRDARAVGPLLELLAREEAPQIRQYAVKALGKIGERRARDTLVEIAADENEKYYTRDAAKSALRKLKRSRRRRRQTSSTPATPIRAVERRVSQFLNRSHPQHLHGPWHAGWALDHHSRFDRGQWERTQTGKLLYKLKYEKKRELAASLGAQLVRLCNAHPELTDTTAIVPIPSSVDRGFDPVRLLARILAEALNLPALSVLEKARQTDPQKNMRTLAEKENNVAGAFTVTGSVTGKRLLLLDDLYDSGATLSEASRTLLQHGAERISVLTVTKTVHTDA